MKFSYLVDFKPALEKFQIGISVKLECLNGQKMIWLCVIKFIFIECSKSFNICKINFE